MNFLFKVILLIVAMAQIASVIAQEKSVAKSELSLVKENQFNIGNTRDVYVTSGEFFDNGGENRNLINKYAITTFHAKKEWIEIYFTEFDIPIGSQLRIYKGDSNEDELFGIFVRNDKISNLKAKEITIEYIPSNINSPATGWKGVLKDFNPSSKGIKSMSESDCPFAIPLCQNQTVTVSMNQYTDCGTVNDDNGDCYSGTGSGGSVWYTFVPQTTGPLDFSISPSGSTDYDFVVWNISGGCGAKTQVLCNYEATHGTTGANSSGTGTSLGSSGGLWCSRPTVTAGVLYAICINFYGGSNDGYVLQFQNEPSSVAITDNVPPTITNAYVNSCTFATTLDIYFSEFVQCPTIQGSDFTLAGHTFTIANDYCNNGKTNHITINVSPGLAPGTYSIHGQDILDMCGNNLNSNYSVVISSVPVANAGPDKLTCKSPGAFGLGWTYSPSSQTLTASGGTSYLWSTGGTNVSTTVSPTSTTVYTVTVANGACTATDNVTVSVDLAPTPNLGPDLAVCPGFPITLNAPAGFTSYQWQSTTTVSFFGTPTGWANIAGANTNTYTASPGVTTYYQVIVTSSNGCQGTDIIKVTIGGAFSGALASPQTVCAGSSSTLSVPGSITSYNWTGGPTNSSWVVTPATTTTYTVTSTTAGCTGPSDVTIVVAPLPIVTATASNLVPCPGDVVNLVSTPTSSSNSLSEDFEGATNIFTLVNGTKNKWYHGTAAFASGTKGLYIGTLATNNNYEIGGTIIPVPIAATNFAYKDLSITSYCSSNLTYKWKCNGQVGKAELSVWLVPTTYTPVAGTAITAGAGNILIGGPFYGQITYQNVSFNMTPYAGQTLRLVYQWMNLPNALLGAPVVANPAASIDDFAFTESNNYSYSWTSVPAGFTSTAQSPAVSPLVNTTYNLTTTRCDGCSNTATASVTMCSTPQIPVANFSVSDTTICVGSCVDFTDLSTGAPTSWNWAFAGAATASSTVQNPTGICYNTVGSYNVTLTATNSNGTNTIIKNLFIIVIPQVTPIFTAVGPFCAGTTISALSTISTNGITGSWSPAINNATTTTYTFTPTAGQCATTTTLTIIVNSSVTPAFAPAGAYCTGSAIPALPTTSTNGINGTWSPAINNTTTTTYTFTPTAGQCASTASIIITVSSSITPTFTAVTPICSGATLAALPTISNNGITGAWSPALNNTATTTYTFTPNAGQCAVSTTLIITVNLPITPNFAAISAICSGTTAPVLGTTSPNGIIGTWSPSVINNSTTGTYLFTPDAGQCALTQSIPVTVNVLPTASAGGDQVLTCAITSLTVNGSGSSSGANFSYTWSTTGGNFISGNTTSSPIVNQAGTYIVTVTNTATSCAATDQMIVTSNTTPPVASAGLDLMLSCTASNINLDGSGSSSGVSFSYSWSTSGGNIVSGATTINPAINQAGTYTITVTNITNGCTITDAVVVTNNSAAPTASGGPDKILNCTVNSVILDGSASSSGVGITYGWSTIGGNIVSGATTTSPSVNQAGTYSITVTNTANGCSSIDLVTVTNNMVLPTASAGADKMLTCIVTSTTIDGSGSSSGLNYTYAWSTTGGSFVSGNTTASPVVNQTGTYTVTVTNTTTGCTSTDQMQVTNNTILPTASAGADMFIACVINTITIDGSGSSAGSNYSYNWSTIGGSFVSGNNTSSPTVNQIGTYSVTVTNAINGCTATDQMVVTNNSTYPVATINQINILCHGQLNGSINLTVNGGNPPYQYLWSNQATTEDISGIGAGVYSVFVSDLYGCTTSTGTTIIEPSEFYISTNPSLSTCYNQPVNLTVSATGGTGPGYNYYWSNGLNGSAITITPTTTSTYTVTATDQNLCSSTANVIVYVSQPISINLISNIDSVCPGEPVLLTPIVTGGVGPPYTIINQDGNIVTPPIYVYPQTSGNYSVSVQDACGTQDVGSVFIKVLPLPLAGFLADSIAGCEPFTVHFNELYPIDGRTFVWDFGDNENLSLAHNPVHTYTRPGVFTVTLTVTSKWGCKTILQYSNMIIVYPKPNAQFSWAPEFASVIKPIIDFNNLTSNGSNYIWTFGDGDSTNQVNPEHRFPGAGSWPVQLIAISNMGCRDTVMYPLEIEEENTLYAPSAFSPDNDNVNDYFFVTGTGIDKNNFLLNIFDRWGEVIFTSTDIERTWNGCVKNTLNKVPVGTYTWLVIYKDSKGIRREKSGPVTIIR